jgi:hypothetical protein
MEMARITHGVTDMVTGMVTGMRAALVVAALLAGAGCGKSICPDGTTLDKQRSKPGASAFCQSTSDASRAVWIELSPGGQRNARRQVCPFIGGRPGGAYVAYHPSGAHWLEGRYESGQKVGRWTQWSPDGKKVAEGEYRDGQLIEGAPVGFPATCESVTW